MYRLLRILTAVVMMAHLVMGCCLHHAHACENMKCTNPTRETASLEIQCSTNVHDGSSHAGHGVQKCQGEKCSFIPSSPTAGSFVMQPFQGLVLSIIDESFALTCSFAEQKFSATGRLLPPVRLHLANQVLLI
jgi:hypothetical protein